MDDKPCPLHGGRGAGLAVILFAVTLGIQNKRRRKPCAGWRAGEKTRKGDAGGIQNTESGVGGGGLLVNDARGLCLL